VKRFQLVVGLVLVGLVVASAIVSLFWTPFDPIQVDGANRLRPPGWPHLLGTDGFGIDIVSQLLVGARATLLVGIVSVGVSAVVGVPLGMVAGQLGGWLDEVVMRAADIPAMAAIGISTIPAFARVSRAGALQVVASDFVLAARVSGTSRLGIAVRHVGPNIAPVVGVQASVVFALAILADAALSYLGRGTPRSVPTWGNMLRQAQDQLFTAPLQSVWPGLAIALAVLGFNLLGDGLRDYLDPRLREVQ